MVNVWFFIFLSGLPSILNSLLSQKVNMSLLFGIIAAILWGLHDFFIRIISQRLGVLNSLPWVLFFGLLFLGVFYLLFFYNSSAYQNNSLNTLLLNSEIILSGFFFALASLALFKAFKSGPIALVAPIIGIYPILSLFLAFIEGIRVKPIIWLMVPIVVAGISLIGANTKPQISINQSKLDNDLKIRNTHLVAVVFSLIAAVSFSLTFHLGQKASTSHHILDVTLYSRLITFIFVVFISIIMQSITFPKKNEFIVLAIMGFLDVCALAFVFSAGNLPMPTLAPVASANFGIFTLIFAYFILGEKLNAFQVVGIVSVFFCLTIILLV